MNTKGKKLGTKIALAVGVLLFVIWGILGAGVSLAWFTDETPVVQNIFNFAEFDLDVEYRNSEMTSYAPMELETNVFLEDALYEPGYTQVVYLKVKNNGEIPLKYKLSIDVRSVTTAKSVLGNEIYLPNYLRYGAAFADSEEMLSRQIAREQATKEMAELRLNSFSEYDSVTVLPGQERYVALVVYMPEGVENAANYRGDTAPSVNLGITVFAEQIK